MNDVKHHAEHTTTEPASLGTEIKHTFLNSSQSHPISVKLEIKKSGEFHHFIVFETGSNFFFLSRGETTTTNSEHLCKVA